MLTSTDHSDQLQRIRTKLKPAAKADRKRQVFGAKSHDYRIGPPVSEADLRAFEERCSLTLPGCYRSFLTGVGNGGPSHMNSAAGPFYGIYPLGEGLDEILERPEVFLSNPVILAPEMTDDEWATLTRRLREDNEISDEDYESELGRIYAGLLPIGSQGCTYFHALLLNGPHKGRVVNLDLDRQKPKFAFEKNFLDWYERWLDEVIAGYLVRDNATWFGYTMGGDDEHLLRVYANAENHALRLEALLGLAKLPTATEQSCRKLLELCYEADVAIRRQALTLLTRFDYPLARKVLRMHLTGDDDNCLAACQSIHWHARKEAKEWFELLRERARTVNHPETFRFLSYLLTASGLDFSEDLRQHCTHENEDIRVSAFYSLGQLKKKQELVEFFLSGLNDKSPKVVHTTLQALAGVRDQRLPAAYARLVDRFKTDEHYIRSNLEHRLKEMGIESIEKFRR